MGGSFSLPENDVDESADERQRERHPGQDVGVAEGVRLRNPLGTHDGVDDGAAHHKQTGKNLEGSGEEEASALLQSEELDEEEEEGEAAEDDGEDHEGLDRLDPLSSRGGVTVVSNRVGWTVVPKVWRARLVGRPNADDGGDEEEDQSGDVQQDDSQ